MEGREKKMNICKIIKYEGDHNVLVYKHPSEDFNTQSQLIVHESQEAILFNNGQMCDSKGPGKYTLNTQNIPLLSKLINLPTGGESQFHSEVYFVNKTLSLDYNWGTSSQARVMDHTYNLLLHIGASGVVGIQIRDPRKLMKKIVGTESKLTAEQCLHYFRENISALVKQYIAQVMKQPGMDFLVLDRYILDFSQAVKERLSSELEDIGIGIYNFIISTIKIPEEEYEVIISGQRQLQQEQYDVKIAQFAKQRRIIEAEGEAAYRRIQGYNWADERIAEIAKTYSANEGAQSSPAGMFAQAPAAFMFGNMLKNNMEPLLTNEFSNPPIAFAQNKATDMQGQPLGGIPVDIAPAQPSQDATSVEIFCPGCGAKLIRKSNFCPECGIPLIDATPNKCRNCGSTLEAGASYCPNCGTKV